MSETTQGELLAYPSNRVSGILDTPEQLDGAVRALGAAAFPDEAILVLCGEEGLRRIDASGAHHGLSGRLTRVTERVFADDGEMEDAEEALRAGRSWWRSSPLRTPRWSGRSARCAPTGPTTSSASGAGPPPT